MFKKRLKLLLILFLIVLYTNGLNAHPEEDDEGDKKTQSGKGGDEGDGDEKDSSLKASKDDSKGKKDKKDGQIMKIIKETVHEVNPIRLISRFDPDPLLSVEGLDVKNLKIPASYFPDSFFDKYSKKTKFSKQEMSKEFGANIESKKDNEWVSIGGILKMGKKKDLRVGDYLEFFGIDMKGYEEKYEQYILDAVKVPVELIDEFILGDGLQKFIKEMKDYVNKNGGPMNAAFKAYGGYSGKDYQKKGGSFLDSVKKFNISKEREEYQKKWDQYRKNKEKETKDFYKKTFGPGGTIEQWQNKAIKTFHAFINFMKSIYSGERVTALMNLAGNAMGPTGRAIVYIVYQPTSTMMTQIFGPLMLISKIMNSQEDSWDKVLALPPVIIQASGPLFKPTLMVIEPLLRWLRFLKTGQYGRSLTSGLDVAAAFGISIWGGAYKPKKLISTTTPKPKKEDKTPKKSKSKGKDDEDKRRRKRQAEAETTEKPKPNQQEKSQEEKGYYPNKQKIQPPPNDGRKLTPDQRMADAYQGGPPPGGYKMGVKNDKQLDLDDEDIIARLLLSPDFILKAGGPVFVPFASVLAPFLRSINTVLFGKNPDIDKRVAEVPDIIRGVGLIGPLADIVQALIPFIRVADQMNRGKLSKSDLVVQSPNLVKHGTSGVLAEVAKKPEKLLKAMLAFFEGHGGLVAMLRLQANANPPRTAPGAAHKANDELKPESDFVIKVLGEFLGEWFLGYIQAIGPIGSMNGAWFNGILGNIIEPAKFLETEVNLKHQPLKNILLVLDDLPRLYKSAIDKKEFLAAVLGGQDSDVLVEVGIDAGKLAQNNIDPGLVLAGGNKFLPPEAKKKLDNEGGLASIGIDFKLMAKIDVNSKSFMESGLLDADPKKLQKNGIDINAFKNRMMRGSVEDEEELEKAGIDTTQLLKSGIDPALFLAVGVKGVPDAQLKAAGINKKQVGEGDFKKLGLNQGKLKSKGIDAKKLAEQGIESYGKIDTGINVEALMTSVYTGLEPKRLSKAGINLKALVSSGIDTKLLLTGGLKGALKGDLSQPGLAKVGINLKVFLGMGINFNLVADAGAAILNPMNLVKLGIDPMRCMISVLSLRGLDALTGGLEESQSISFQFVTSILKIIHISYDSIPLIRQIPYVGPMIVDKNGKFKGQLGFILYKIIGIEGNEGLFAFLKKLFNGTATKEDVKKLIKSITGDDGKPKGPSKIMMRRPKADHKPIEEYMNKSVDMRVGQSATMAPKGIKQFSNLFGKGKGGSTEAPPDGGEGAQGAPDDGQGSGGGGGEGGGQGGGQGGGAGGEKKKGDKKDSEGIGGKVPGFKGIG